MTPDAKRGTYGEAWPDLGPWLTTADLDRDVLFVRVNSDGAVCGKSHTPGDAVLRRPDGSWLSLGACDGNSSVAFGPDATVYVSRADGVHVFGYNGTEFTTRFTPGYLGSQGIRYVQADGTVVSGDATYGDGTVSEYTILSDGTRIGQGHDGGIVAETSPGVARRLTAAGAYHVFVRVIESGPESHLAICYTDFQRNYRILTTLADVRALPIDGPLPPEQPIGPVSQPRAADGRLYDLGAFLLSASALQPRRGPTHPQAQLDLSNGLTHFVKFNNPQAYETWAMDDYWIYHLEDGLTSFSDQRWWPRHLPIGEAHAFDTGEHDLLVRDRGTCAVVRRDPIRRKMWLHAIYDEFYWGPDLGTRATAVCVYDNTAGIHTADRLVELYYFAAGAGWCRWEAYRSDLVYAHGPALFSDAARTARSDFYLVGGTPIAVALTGCVPQVCPHYPPLQLPIQLPERGHRMLIDPAKELLYYTKLLPSTRNAGLVTLQKPNGKVYSIRSGGATPQVSEQPSNYDGGNESAQVANGCATYLIDGEYVTFAAQPIDKLL